MMNFTKTLSNFNINSLNEMQLASIKAISNLNDVVLISPTGSGKTLAYLLPLLTILEKDNAEIQALLLVPTRELAIQIEQVFKKMNTGYKVNTCYGGHDAKTEKNNLLSPPALLIGTPGRINDHLIKNNFRTDNIKTLLLDEFDKSLEAGFHEEMEFIIKKCTALKQRILISATNLEEIPTFVGIQNNQEIIFLDYTSQSKTSLKIKYVRVIGDDKLESLMLLLGKLSNKSTVVFCNHREAVNRISEQLTRHKIGHGIYHGGLEQMEREKTIIKLRNGSIQLLIATDLAARGIDIPEIESVIHYQLPDTEDTMTHRNGRTARMYATGTVYFLLDKEDNLPGFLNSAPEEELPKKFISPKPTQWKTLYIAAGKKDKINKIDIVGALLKNTDLQKDELGRIDVLDFSAYVAVKSQKIESALNAIKELKIKNKKIKIQLAS